MSGPWEKYAEQSGPWDKYASMQQPEERGFFDSLRRQLGLTARAGIEGAGGALALPGTLADAATGLIDKTGILPSALPKFNSASLFPRAADALGLPTPANEWERVGGAGAQATAGMGGLNMGAGAIQQASKSASPFLKMLTANPGLAVQSAAGSGAAEQIAKEKEVGPLGQLGASVAGGLAFPLGVGAVGKIGGTIGDIGQTIGAAAGNKSSIQKLSADAAQKAAGQDREKVIAALQSRTQDIPGYKPSVAEALGEANIGQEGQLGGKTIRLQRDLTGAAAAPDTLTGNERTQKIALDRYVEGVKAETAPLRERVINDIRGNNKLFTYLDNNLSKTQTALENAVQDEGRFNTIAAQQENLANNFVPVPGMPRVAGRVSQNAERVPEAISASQDTAQIAAVRRAKLETLNQTLANLEANGAGPLKVEDTLKRIAELSNQPGRRVSDVVQKTMGDVQEKIASLPNNKGYVDPEDLYWIRKEIGNTITKYSKETQNWDKRLTSGIERDIQRAIDSSIEQSIGNSGKWNAYLKTYSEGMRRVENVQERLAEAKGIASKVRSGSRDELMRGEVPMLPTLLSRPMMLANYGLKMFSKSATDPVTLNLAEKMRDPAEYAKLLTMVEQDPFKVRAQQMFRNSLLTDVMNNGR